MLLLMELIDHIENLRNRIDSMSRQVHTNHDHDVLTLVQFKLCMSMLNRVYHCVEMAKDVMYPIGEPD